MNKLQDNGQIFYDFDYRLEPQIKIKYLLEKIYGEAGFSVDFSGLNDTEWQKLLLINVTRVDWLTIAQTANGIGPAPSNTIIIDLKEHLPQEKTISDFIVQLYGRYGWAPVFDVVSKKVRMVTAKELGKGTRKDWTRFAEPVINTSFNEDKKIFAFTNKIDSKVKTPTIILLKQVWVG